MAKEHLQCTSCSALPFLPTTTTTTTNTTTTNTTTTIRQPYIQAIPPPLPPSISHSCPQLLFLFFPTFNNPQNFPHHLPLPLLIVLPTLHIHPPPPPPPPLPHHALILPSPFPHHALILPSSFPHHSLILPSSFPHHSLTTPPPLPHPSPTTPSPLPHHSLTTPSPLPHQYPPARVGDGGAGRGGGEVQGESWEREEFQEGHKPTLHNELMNMVICRIVAQNGIHKMNLKKKIIKLKLNIVLSTITISNSLCMVSLNNITYHIDNIFRQRWWPSIRSERKM